MSKGKPSFRIDDEKREAARKKSERLGIPVSAVVRAAYTTFIEESDEQSMAKHGGRLAQAREQQ